MMMKIDRGNNRKKLSSIKDRGETGHVTTLPRPHPLGYAAVAGIGRFTPHAQWRRQL